MSAGVSSDVQCEDSPTGLHEWMCITMQLGQIVGVDSTGAPIFIPDDTAGFALDSPCWAEPQYGCAHCSEPWITTLQTS